MTIIPLTSSIHRDQKTGKKFYRYLNTGKPANSPGTPKGWETATEYNDLTHKQCNSYALRCDDDLIVIDCDDKETTELIHNILEPSTTSTKHYIAVSDKGFKHYYFEPSEYYKKSPLYKDTRLGLNKLDVLHGRSLVFAVCKDNETKTLLQGTPSTDPANKLGYELTQIPDNIVDALIDRLGKVVLAEDTDYRPLASYLAPQIEMALGLFGRSGNYLDIQPVMQLITPAKYKQDVQPDYHPDRIRDGDGANYIQALSTKLAQDPSVSVDLHTEVIRLITQKLWSDPWDDARIATALSNLTTQKYSATGNLIFVYNPNATSQPLVSINGNEYMPIYRTLEDEYLLAKPNGEVETIKGQSNFKKAMASKNYSLLVDSKPVNLDNAIALKKVSDAMKTVTKRELPYYDTGEFEEEGSLYYNTYRPTKYLGIIRGTYLQDATYQGPESHPMITMIIQNIMWDNLQETPAEDHNSMYTKLLKFLAYKLKTLEHSELVFQLMGWRGTGKNKFLAILRNLTNSVVKVNFNASNTQFNEDQVTAMFLSEEEGKITKSLQETVKQLSGDEMRRIEGKGKTAFMARSVATYIVSNNDTIPLAQTVDDRRVVTFSSWKATPLDRLPVTDIDIKLKLELEAFALCLREQKLDNKKLYLSAKEWHDDVHFTNFEEQASKAQDLPSRLKLLHERSNTKTGEEIHKELTYILGAHYHFSIFKSKLYLPLQRSPRLIRLYDSAELTHEITREQLKSAGLDSYCQRDKSGNNPYGVPSYYRLYIDLAPKQIEYFNSITALGEDFEIEGEDIDIADA